jgi:outer membrane protein insertion porin family
VIRRLTLLAGVGFLSLAPRALRAQDTGQVPDSIAVIGLRRLPRTSVLLTAGLAAGRPVSFRDVQRAIQALYASGQYQDVAVEADTAAGHSILVIRVKERPLLLKWSVRGPTRVSERSVKDRVQLIEGRPLDPAGVERSRARIDSLYRADGYYLARVTVHRVYEADSARVRIVFDIDEGHRVAVAKITFQGNTHFPAATLAAEMNTRPEGFWWWQSGELDDDKLQEDLQEKLPTFYGSRGYVDFQVLDDTLIVNDTTGKAALLIRVSEGDPYRVGTFEIVGNRRFTTDELTNLYPFTPQQTGKFLGIVGKSHTDTSYFNQTKWDDATQKLYTAYRNEGYLYTSVRNDVIRRTGVDGKPVVDVRWVIQEGQPAIVNKIEIVGNDVTHEGVIRDALEMLPGDVFRQAALIRSYQNLSNLGFFQQPLPFPEPRPANDQGDVDVVFHVQEKRTGNVNFGASVGQGTGLGGFLGLDEPNLFGQGKKGHFQWQFGKNINDFDVSYTDPQVRDSRVTATLDLHNTRLRYSIADLGQLRRRGGSLQLGLPVFKDRHSMLFVSYSLDDQSFDGSASNQAFALRFGCSNCIRSTIGFSVLRDNRVDLPFATAGTMTSVGLSQSGGLLGGTGDFQRLDLEGRWYAPLGQLGGTTPGSSPVKFVLGLSTRAGFVFGNSPFFDQLFTMGGTQFGIPLRGYDEFSITPQGYDPNAASGQASGANSFGKAFFSMTTELGMRVSQALYLDGFFDAGNVWGRPAEFNPTRLFRGAGFGAAVISPLGPIGIDLGYGFDKVDISGHPTPGWKLHFKLGNFF